MKVALFGGTGFVGGYLVDELIDQGHTPVVLVRPGSEHKLRHADACLRVGGAIEDPDAVRRTLEGADAAIYNIGILRAEPRRGVTFESLHLDGAKRAMELAAATGVSRFLLMSANGVCAEGTAYQKTKFMAEQYLQDTPLQWTVFRPSVLFGDPRGNMEFASQLYRDIVSWPIPAPLFYDGLLPVHAGSLEMSPIHVADVAHIVVASLERPETFGRIYPLGGPDRLSWKAILQTIAAATGKRLFGVPVPIWMMKAVVGLVERLPEFPMTRDQLTMLIQGNTCDSREVFVLFGMEPKPFSVENLAYLKARRRGPKPG